MGVTVRILVSNDDGVQRAGLAALVEAMTPLGEVWVVAPSKEMSGVSQAITLDRPLRIQGYQGRERWFQVDGTPTDCVYLALHHLMLDARPDLVVSGINHGSNLGTDAHYSGTVSAAHEGMNNGIPSLAFSLVSGGKDADFRAAAAFAQRCAAWVIEEGLPPDVLLNCNIPRDADGRFAVCNQGRRTYAGTRVVHRKDPRGVDYCWIGGTEVLHGGDAWSDTTAHDQGLITVMPIQRDRTAYNALAELGKMRLDGQAPEQVAPKPGASE